jgi:hypothetical protein
MRPLPGYNPVMVASLPPHCRHAGLRGGFHFPVATGVVVKCWRCAVLHRPMLRRSATIAFLVGTVLALINHGDALWRGDWTAATLLKIGLTYCVPFAVASWGALLNSRVPPSREPAARRSPR